MIPDVNVLVAAFRRDHSQHPAAVAWIEDALAACARGGQTLVLLPTVVAGFLRIVTHRSAFTEPETLPNAITAVDRWLALPGVEIRTVAAWPQMRAIALPLGLAGNWITDIWIAAQVEALGEHLVTFDRDFLRLLAARDLTLLE